MSGEVVKRNAHNMECSEFVQVVEVEPVTIASEMCRHRVHGPLGGQGTDLN